MKELTETEKIELKKTYEIKWKTLFNGTFKYWLASPPCEKQIIYPCYACKHIFHVKSSLIDHVNRRGMQLQYNCPICANPTLMIFYNPCALLLHARTHYTTSHEEIDLDNITISMLPFSMIGLNAKVRIPQMYDVDEDNMGQSTTISTAFYSAAPSTLGQRIVILQPYLFKYDASTKENPNAKLFLRQISLNIPHCMFVMLICPDCSQSVLPENRAQHYFGENKLIPDKICNICQYTACSPCQLTAHHRLHSKLPPYICPECGNIFETHKTLFKHLAYECFHFNKQIHYKCDINSCDKAYVVITSYNTHFIKHMKITLVCDICRTVINYDEFISHNTNLHKNNAILIESYECLGCKETPKPFKTCDNSAFHSHVKEHRISHKFYIYKCDDCYTYYKTILDYYDHRKKCGAKKPLINPISCKICDRIITTEQEVDKHFRDCFKKMKVKCILCGEMIRLLQMKHHMGEQTFNSSLYKDFVDVEKAEKGLIQCKYQQPVVMVEQYKGPSRVTLKQNRLPCKRKQDIEVNLVQTEYQQPVVVVEPYKGSLKKNQNDSLHNKKQDIGINLVQKEYQQPVVMVDPYKSPCTLTLKQNQNDSLHNKKQDIGITLVRTEYQQPVVMVEPYKDPCALTLLQNQNDLPFIKQQNFEITIARTDDYICRRCGFNCADRSNFHAHIKEHRKTAGSMKHKCQCMECGMLFSPRALLSKHLRSIHQIDDVEEYFQNNDYTDSCEYKSLV